MLSSNECKRRSKNQELFGSKHKLATQLTLLFFGLSRCKIIKKVIRSIWKSYAKSYSEKLTEKEKVQHLKDQILERIVFSYTRTFPTNVTLVLLEIRQIDN